jgi:hypothetical protein
MQLQALHFFEEPVQVCVTRRLREGTLRRLRGPQEGRGERTRRHREQKDRGRERKEREKKSRMRTVLVVGQFKTYACYCAGRVTPLFSFYQTPTRPTQ